MTITSHFSAIGLLLTLTAVAGCQQGEPGTPAVNGLDVAVTEQSASKGVAIGDIGPAFDELEGVDGQKHGLDDYATAKLVAVVFTCNHCPVAQAYEDRLIALADDYQSQGVQFIAINVNNIEEDRLPKMKERANEKGFNFPYIYDPSQAIARAYGATVTPHVFVLNDQRRVAYMGAIDDNQDESKVTQRYLREALDALLAGSAPATAITQQFGCSIKYE